MFWLHFAFILSVLVQLTKLGDFVLLPIQKSRIQHKVEIFALEIDSINPFRWTKILYNKVGFKIILFLSCLFLIGFAAYNQYLIGREYFKLNNNISDLILLILAVLGAIILPTTLAIFHYNSIGIKISKWLFINNSTAFFPRLILFALAGTALILLLSKYPDFMAFSEDYFPALIDFLILLISASIFIYWILGFLIIWFAFLNVGIIITIGYLILSTLAITIKITRWLTWRIAHYNKGAWAAITLLATFILGILELILVYSKK